MPPSVRAVADIATSLGTDTSLRCILVTGKAAGWPVTFGVRPCNDVTEHRAGRVCVANPSLAPVFDTLRQSLQDLLDARLTPDARRALISEMKQTLALARVGVEDLRAAITATQTRLEAQRAELETVRRRKTLAEGIKDQETVTIAAKYEAQVTERLQILERKFEVQQEETALAERELDEMTAALKLGITSGPAPASTSLGAQAEAAVGDSSGLADELDSLSRGQARARRDADAADRLAALKRRMGK